MAFPVILVDSATGSDSAASGAGPATALTGTAASFSSGTVTLDGSPDLSGVATDGSHVLYLVTSTGVRFFKITAKDNTAKTVDVTHNPAGTSTGLSWAIGGKRASIGSASSRLLFEQGVSAGDAMPGWVVEMQDGHAETISARITCFRDGDPTIGPLILRGAAGASVRPKITMSANDYTFVVYGQYWQYSGFAGANTNGTKTTSALIINVTGSYSTRITDILIDEATDKFGWGIYIQGAQGTVVEDCEIAHCVNHGIFINPSGGNDGGYRITGNYCHHNGDGGIYFNANAIFSSFVAWNICYANAGHGIYYTNTRGDALGGAFFIGNTLDANGGAGFKNETSSSLDVLAVINNIASNNGTYGFYFTQSAAQMRSNAFQLRNNDTYNNTSGASTPSGVLVDDPGLDPAYTDAANGDFSIGPNLASLGYPANIGPATTNYLDIGAAQRAPGGGGSGGGLRPVGVGGLVG